MKSYPKDDNYAQAQRDYNYLHTNQQMVNQDDWNTARKLVKRVRTTWPKLEIENALVLGCRCGQECFALQEEYNCYTLGVDIVPEFLEHATKYTKTHLGDMHSLPFADQIYDLVFCAGTLEHCYDPQKAVNEMCRIARKAIYVGMDLEEDRGDFKSHYSFSQNPEEWKALFVSHPFKIVKTTVESRALHLYLRRELCSSS